MKMKKLRIHGGRWFSRNAGNTYHVALITVDDEVTLKVGEQYGYGDQYLESAKQVLIANGYDVPDWFTYSGLREAGIDYEYTVTDFDKRRDMRAFVA